MKSVTIEHIESLITEETYSNTGKTTVCILKLQNGFEVVGTSGVVDVSKFDEALGKKYAREDAINKIWTLEGYRLQCDLCKPVGRSDGDGHKYKIPADKVEEFDRITEEIEQVEEYSDRFYDLCEEINTKFGHYRTH